MEQTRMPSDLTQIRSFATAKLAPTMQKYFEAKHSEKEYRRISKKLDANKSKFTNLPDVTKAVLMRK